MGEFGIRPTDVDHVGHDEASITFVDVTGSTNDDVRAMALDGAPHGSAVVARSQTAGRGRRGHAWESPRGGLYLSVLLRPTVDTRLFAGLPAAVALGALRVLRAHAPEARIELKWPNDFVVGGRKLAGLLVEAGRGAPGTFAIAGLGVNLAAPTVRDSHDPHAGAAVPSLRAVGLTQLVPDVGEGCSSADAFELAGELRRGMVSACDDWCDALVQRASSEVGPSASDGPLLPVLGEYNDALAMRHHEVVALAQDGSCIARGILERVDDWGRALLRQADGSVVSLASEQASLRATCD